MSKHLKKFSTHSEYDIYINGSDAILPNVSICTAEGDVHYNPYVQDDPYNGHEYVEIGGLKWATMNVGANSITDYGLYFQWGDTQGYNASQCGSGAGQKYFSWEDYKYNNGVALPYDTDFTKYNSTDGKTVLEASDDAVQANWGGQWRMPTRADFLALLDATDNTWTTITIDNVTVSGEQFTDKVDNSKVLFFPACGDCRYGGVVDVGSMGNYLFSSLYIDSNYRSAYCLDFTKERNGISSSYRCVGLPIRGVID